MAKADGRTVMASRLGRANQENAGYDNIGAASAQDSLRIKASLREGHILEMRQFLTLLQPETPSEALGLLRRAFPLSVLSDRVEACEGYHRHRAPRHAA